MLMLALAGALFSGCAQVTIKPDPQLVPRPLPTTFDDKDWAAVLRDHVRNGLVDYNGLQRSRDPLDRYYGLISAMGPTTAPDQFPTRYHKMAYDINAYNALVLCAVLQDPTQPYVYDVSMPSLETDIAFVLDGRQTTLEQIEERLLKNSDGDVRVIFALSRAALGTPALRNEPYRADSMERQLQEAAAAALDNPYLLQIDSSQHAIFAWQGIIANQGAFLDYWQARRRTRAPTLLSVLTDMASPRRRQLLSAAIGYSIRVIPFERRLNRGTPEGTGAAPVGAAARP
jgi:hypothetical protein